MTNAVREVGMRELYRMNITYATLFPDLDGLAKSMGYELEFHWATIPAPWRSITPDRRAREPEPVAGGSSAYGRGVFSLLDPVRPRYRLFSRPVPRRGGRSRRPAALASHVLQAFQACYRGIDILRDPDATVAALWRDPCPFPENSPFSKQNKSEKTEGSPRKINMNMERFKRPAASPAWFPPVPASRRSSASCRATPAPAPNRLSVCETVVFRTSMECAWVVSRSSRDDMVRERSCSIASTICLVEGISASFPACS